MVVKLYVYDVTRGLARVLAPYLLGGPLDGVWHTGIVVFGHEFFFGMGGIGYCLPSGTILGLPTQIVELGETQISNELFEEYLLELSLGRFRGSEYHLTNHNCNTFSNEVAQFLTGRGIPEHILSLPADLLATPLGQVIRPFIDNMTKISTGANVNHVGQPATQKPANQSPNPSKSAPNNDGKKAS